jgi:hypothetical protein
MRAMWLGKGVFFLPRESRGKGGELLSNGTLKYAAALPGIP